MPSLADVMSNVTLKKISELAGVSIRTVNRALKNQPGVKPELCKRIQDLANRLGYTPNVAARNLRLQRTNFVGLIISNYRSTNIIMRKVNDIQQQLYEHGFFPLLGLLPNTEDELRNILQEWAGMVQTVVILSWNKQFIPSISLQGFSQQFIFVDIGGISGYHSIAVNRDVGIHEGVTELLRRGRRRIARCGNINSRAEGFTRALYDFNDKTVEHHFFETEDSSFEVGYEIGVTLIEQNFDAVFFDTDRMAYGFLKYCWERNIRIPEQISVIGFDNEPLSNYCSPALSTVAHPLSEISVKIAELAVSPESPRQFEFSTRFISRESV